MDLEGKQKKLNLKIRERFVEKVEKVEKVNGWMKTAIDKEKQR